MSTNAARTLPDLKPTARPFGDGVEVVWAPADRSYLDMVTVTHRPTTGTGEWVTQVNWPCVGPVDALSASRFGAAVAAAAALCALLKDTGPALVPQILATYGYVAPAAFRAPVTTPAGPACADCGEEFSPPRTITHQLQQVLCPECWLSHPERPVTANG